MTPFLFLKEKRENVYFFMKSLETHFLRGMRMNVRKLSDKARGERLLYLILYTSILFEIL